MFRGSRAERVLGACAFPSDSARGAGAAGGAGRGARSLSGGAEERSQDGRWSPAQARSRGWAPPAIMAAPLSSQCLRRLQIVLSILKPGNQVPRAGPAAAFG